LVEHGVLVVLDHGGLGREGCLVLQGWGPDPDPRVALAVLVGRGEFLALEDMATDKAKGGVRVEVLGPAC